MIQDNINSDTRQYTPAIQDRKLQQYHDSGVITQKDKNDDTLRPTENLLNCAMSFQKEMRKVPTYKFKAIF